MIELHDDHVFYAFSRDLEPVLDVDSGTTVRIRTKDCFGNQVQKWPARRKGSRSLQGCHDLAGHVAVGHRHALSLIHI